MPKYVIIDLIAIYVICLNTKIVLIALMKIEKISKVKYKQQTQKNENGKLYIKSNRSITVSNGILKDMNINQQENEVILSYDTDTKEITIKKKE